MSSVLGIAATMILIFTAICTVSEYLVGMSRVQVQYTRDAIDSVAQHSLVDQELEQLELK